MTKRVGRPKQMPPPERQVSIEQAVELVAERRKKFGMKPVSKGHIYNLISDDKLHRWGTAKMAILDADEVLERLCG